MFTVSSGVCVPFDVCARREGTGLCSPCETCSARGSAPATNSSLPSFGSFLISLTAVEPCPSSSPCHQLSVWLSPFILQIQRFSVFFPAPPLASCCILALGDPSSVLYLKEVFFPRDLQVSYTLLSLFFPLFFGKSLRAPCGPTLQMLTAGRGWRMLFLKLCSWEKQGLQFLGGTFSALHFSVPSQEQLQEELLPLLPWVLGPGGAAEE